MVEHKHTSSIDKHFATVKHNYRTADRTSDDEADHYDTGCCIQVNCQRGKNQLNHFKPFLSVVVLLINVVFSNYLIFNKLLRENCSNNFIFNIWKIATFIATFTSSRTVIATKSLKTLQLSSQLFRKAHQAF